MTEPEGQPQSQARKKYLIQLQVATEWTSMTVECMSDLEAATIGSSVATALFPKISSFSVLEIEGSRPVCNVPIVPIITQLGPVIAKILGGMNDVGAHKIVTDREGMSRFIEEYKKRMELRRKGDAIIGGA